MRPWLQFFMIALAALIAATPANGKPVSGVVRDSKSTVPLANVIVKIYETGDSTQTNGSGIYFFPDIQLGTYTFMVGGDQHVPAILTNVVVSNSCCIGTTGNINKSPLEAPDLSDLSLLITYLTVSPRPTLPCALEANVNNAGTTDLSDLSLLIAYLTQSPRPSLPNCP